MSEETQLTIILTVISIAVVFTMGILAYASTL